MAKVYATPGVYIEEKSAFTTSAVPVATAVPAFIGYTEKAMRGTISLKGVPTRITSYGEYRDYFGGPPKTKYKINKQIGTSSFELVEPSKRFILDYSMRLFFANGGSDCYIISVGDYSGSVDKAALEEGLEPLLKEAEPTMIVIPDAVHIEERGDFSALQSAMLKHCGDEMRERVAILDVHNGYKTLENFEEGKSVVANFREDIGVNFLQWASVYYPWLETSIAQSGELDINNFSNLGDPPKEIPKPSEDISVSIQTSSNNDLEVDQKVNFTVKVMNIGNDKLKDLKATIELKDGKGVVITTPEHTFTPVLTEGLDIKGSTSASVILPITQAIVDSGGLYFEVEANGTPDKVGGVEQTAADGGSLGLGYKEDVGLSNYIGWGVRKAFRDNAISYDRAIQIQEELGKLKSTAKGNDDDIRTLSQTLMAVSPDFKTLMNGLRQTINVLPPSGAMAGIYSMVDNNVGVWQSPANVSVGSVIKPTVNITHDDQEDLNVPLNGKAVNAIRTFPGKGTLVWGARTLDGNSMDWRYISVRRTVIFIEQSIKNAAETYVFAPNTSLTWTNVNAMITNFLTNVWQQGGLAGSTPEDAFSVEVGLGVTMTAVDILDGIMRVTVKIAVTRPAEFIVITFEQQMQKS